MLICQMQWNNNLKDKASRMSSHGSSLGGATPKDSPDRSKGPNPIEPPKVDPIEEDDIIKDETIEDNKAEEDKSNDEKTKDDKGTKSEEDYIKTLLMTSFPDQHKNQQKEEKPEEKPAPKQARVKKQATILRTKTNNAMTTINDAKKGVSNKLSRQVTLIKKELDGNLSKNSNVLSNS